MSMDLSDLAALHAAGYDTTARSLFAERCRQLVADRHAVPSGVSHLVHYTTLDALMSLLGAPGSATTDYPLAPRSSREVHDNRRASMGHLRLYDTFSSNDPNEGAFFINAASVSRQPPPLVRSCLAPV